MLGRDSAACTKVPSVSPKTSEVKNVRRFMMDVLERASDRKQCVQVRENQPIRTDLRLNMDVRVDSR